MLKYFYVYIELSSYIKFLDLDHLQKIEHIRNGCVTMNFRLERILRGHSGLFSHSDRLSKPLHQRLINQSWIEMGVSPAITR